MALACVMVLARVMVLTRVVVLTRIMVLTCVMALAHVMVLARIIVLWCYGVMVLTCDSWRSVTHAERLLVRSRGHKTSINSTIIFFCCGMHTDIL